MVAEGGPVTPEPEVEAATVGVEEPEGPAYPPYPGPDGFYAGSQLLGSLQALREHLGVEVPEGAENAGYRGHDFEAISRKLQDTPRAGVTEAQWVELWA